MLAPALAMRRGFARPARRMSQWLGAASLRELAVALSAFAALTHDLALPAHYREWWGYGACFFAMAAAQFFYSGVLLFWPGRRVYWAGIIGNLPILIVYVISRTQGIPVFGPLAGMTEPVGVLDGLTAVAELALTVTLFQLYRSSRRRGPSSARRVAPPMTEATPC